MSDRDTNEEEDSSNDRWKKKIYKSKASKGESVASSNDNDRYVVPNDDRGGWDVKRENAQRASGHFNTQADAIKRAKEIVENTGGGQGETRIQGRNGKFRDSDSGSKNESPKKDTKH
jgi:hypothetical protein